MHKPIGSLAIWLASVTVIGAGIAMAHIDIARADARHGHGQINMPDKSHGHQHGLPVGGVQGMAKDVSRTIVIETKDLAFSMKKIPVSNGETIRFVVRNTSEIEHDFTIGTPKVQKSHRQEMLKMMEAMASHSNDHAAMKHDDPNAVFVKPGETKQLIWKFTRTASLEFGCNVPGHYESGMRGKFRFN